MDYRAALKTVLTLASVALFFTSLVLFEVVAMIFVVICAAAMIFVIVALIYMGFKGDLPEM